MRGRLTAVDASELTAELRERLAKANNTSGCSAEPGKDAGCALGARAVRMAHLAAALHMALAAGHAGDGSSAGARNTTP